MSRKKNTPPVLPTRRIILLQLAILLLVVGLTGMTVGGLVAPLPPTPDNIWYLLLFNTVLLAVLCLTIGVHLRLLWKRFRHAMARSRLQRRIIISFCLVTVLPTFIVAIFSAAFFNLGIQAWFNDKVNTAVEESMAVAEAYLNEHRDNIRLDALALADDINRFYGSRLVTQLEFNRFVSSQATRRQLTEVVIFQGNRIMAQGRLSFSLAFESLPLNALERASDGDVVILQGEKEDDRVRALTRLDSVSEGFLLVGRLVDDKVIHHMESTEGAVNTYRDLKNELVRLQWTFSLLFVMFSLALLLTAVWYGLIFASRLITPIGRLAVAAERVRAGDYTGRVETDRRDDEISILSRTFNRMVDQLDTQRRELIAANRELDDRRRFSEAVLGGVSAGVLALDKERVIHLLNKSASIILDSEEETLTGKAIPEVIPGIGELLAEAEERPGKSVQSSVSLVSGTSARTLHMRAVAEYNANELDGYILTFDDITPLVNAQRDAAWADVARRVAHEIKNPLTPIALSAERLKRKYEKLVPPEESENFSRYIDTIGRHVTDIGRMVEEFVAFARMPGAVMRDADLVEILRRVVFSEQVAHPTIKYAFICEPPALSFRCDERQIAQVISNILKNAAEAIEGEQAETTREGNAPENGEITVALECIDDRVNVTITDSGPGFPEDKIHTMLEPYVTTRSKGTGLGLAIVKKIVEEHGGSLTLANREEQGAIVMLSFLQQCDIKVATTN